MKIRFLPEAAAELQAAAEWYERKREGLGQMFLGRVDRTVEQIAAMPRSFPLHAAGLPYRHALLAQFPHAVVFREISGGLRIIAIAHQKRRPGYWRGR